MANIGRRRPRFGAVVVRSEEGAAAVEFAIVATLLFLIVFGIIQFGILFERYEALVSSARDGGRVAATRGNLPTIQSAVVNATPFTINCAAGTGTSCVTVSVNPAAGTTTPCDTSNPGAMVTVAVAYKWTPPVPFIPAPKSFTSQGVFRCE